MAKLNEIVINENEEEEDDENDEYDEESSGMSKRCVQIKCQFEIMYKQIYRGRKPALLQVMVG